MSQEVMGAREGRLHCRVGRRAPQRQPVGMHVLSLLEEAVLSVSLMCILEKPASVRRSTSRAWVSGFNSVLP